MLAEFQKLYEAAVPIQRLKTQATEEYVAFLTKTGKPVVLANAQKHLSFLPHHESFYQFWQENPTFWIIPVDLPSGVITGYVMRGFQNSVYRIYTPPDGVQLAFGWFDFGSFKPGYPIILTEGAKDRQFLSFHYIYTLGLLTARCSSELRKVLRQLTRKVIFALDNDRTGKDMTVRMRKEFQEDGFTTTTLEPKEKDWGKYYSRSNLQGLAQAQVAAALAKLGCKVA